MLESLHIRNLALVVELDIEFGDDPTGVSEPLSTRTDTGKGGRFRRFSRQGIADCDDNLDIAWIRGDEEVAAEDLRDIVRDAMGELGSAVDEVREALDELGEEVQA